MKIHQMLPNYWYGDAIGNHATAIRDLLRRWGHESEIFADVIHEKLSARPYGEFLDEPDDAWVIYHYSTGSLVNNFALEKIKNLIIIYHNITPPRFFEPYDRDAAINCREGKELLKKFVATARLAIGVSEYNVDELKELGFKSTAVAPLILDFDKINPGGKSPFSDDKTNILFVGRLSPNKRHEDLVKVFHFYRNYVDTNSRLVLVGWADENGLYYKSITRLIETMNLPDVVITGAVSDSELGDYFKSASIYLCLSQHEGFCVPLIEAMRFGAPVVALASSGVTDTMGYAGALVDKMEPNKIAELMGIIVEDGALRERIVKAQYARVEDFSPEKMSARLKKVLASAIDGFS